MAEDRHDVIDPPGAAPAGNGGAEPDRPAVPRRSGTGTFTYGISVGELLEVPALARARLLGGAHGLSRIVQRLNVMEVPDILAWVKPHELLLTTGYPLRGTPQSLDRLVADLDERGLAALAIKLGRYLDDLPVPMIERADRLGFPLIRLPDDVAFDDILNQALTDILNRQAAAMARAEEAHRALVQIVLGGGGLAEVAAEVAASLDVSVAVLDADGKRLAGAGPDEPAGGAGGCTCVPIVAGGVRHGTLEARAVDAVQTPATIATPAAGRAIHGVLPGGLTESDVGILERAATVAALVITKQQAVTAVESKYRADFLRDVFAGRAGSGERVVARGAAFGWDLDRACIVLAAELDEPAGNRSSGSRRGEVADLPTGERLLAAFTSALRRADARAAVAGFSTEVVAVFGAEVDADRVVRDARATFADHPGAKRTFCAGYGRRVAAPDGLAAGYEQAGTAVRVGRRMHGAGAVAAFDSLGVYRLLSLIDDTAELHAFVAETLGELAGDGDPEAADLRRTLRVLLETNLNVAETARRLHFHYNTLRYRIGKLERMLGPFTQDAHLRLNLNLALYVLRMKGI